MYETYTISPKEIKAHRKALMLTQRQLASYIGVTKETIKTWERGICKPSYENYSKLYSFFDENRKKIDEAFKVTKERYRERKAKAQTKDESGVLSFQLMLFDVSVFETEKTKRRIRKRRTQKSAKPKAESLQCKLW
jgi:DNA-binding XRE family transcriptional regulator